MTGDPPTPPADLPEAIDETLEEYAANQLRAVANYAERLAEYKDRSGSREAQSADDGPDMDTDERPDDVPAKATITVKEINDNRYYYWQWREGNSVTSKYKTPVDTDE